MVDQVVGAALFFHRARAATPVIGVREAAAAAEPLNKSWRARGPDSSSATLWTIQEPRAPPCVGGLR